MAHYSQVQTSSVQFSPVQPKTAQYIPVEPSTAQHSTVAAQYIPVQPAILVNVVAPVTLSSLSETAQVTLSCLDYFWPIPSESDISEKEIGNSPFHLVSHCALYLIRSNSSKKILLHLVLWKTRWWLLGGILQKDERRCGRYLRIFIFDAGDSASREEVPSSIKCLPSLFSPHCTWMMEFSRATSSNIQRRDRRKAVNFVDFADQDWFSTREAK